MQRMPMHECQGSMDIVLLPEAQINLRSPERSVLQLSAPYLPSFGYLARRLCARWKPSGGQDAACVLLPEGLHIVQADYLSSASHNECFPAILNEKSSNVGSRSESFGHPLGVSP